MNTLFDTTFIQTGNFQVYPPIQETAVRVICNDVLSIKHYVAVNCCTNSIHSVLMVCIGCTERLVHNNMIRPYYYRVCILEHGYLGEEGHSTFLLLYTILVHVITESLMVNTY